MKTDIDKVGLPIVNSKIPTYKEILELYSNISKNNLNLEDFINTLHENQLLGLYTFFKMRSGRLTQIKSHMETRGAISHHEKININIDREVKLHELLKNKLTMSKSLVSNSNSSLENEKLSLLEESVAIIGMASEGLRKLDSVISQEKQFLGVLQDKLSIDNKTFTNTIIPENIIINDIRNRRNIIPKLLFQGIKKIEPYVTHEKKLHGVLKNRVQTTASHTPVPVNTTSFIEGHAVGTSMASSAMQYSLLVQATLEIIPLIISGKLNKEALHKFTIKIATIGGTTYIKGLGMSMLASAMKGASNSILRRLGHSNLPALLVINANIIIKDINDFYCGRIKLEEFITRLTRTGSDMTISGTCMTAGQLAIPIPVVGGIIGGLVGYTLNQAYFSSFMKLLQEKAVADERLKRVEEIRLKSIKQLQEEQQAFEQKFVLYHKMCCNCFDQAMRKINEGLINNDPDLVIEAANQMTETLGGTSTHNSVEDFENKLMDNSVFKF